jgi:hypothetical protein
MVYQLSTILGDVSSSIQKLYKSKSTNLHGDKYSPKSVVEKKNLQRVVHHNQISIHSIREVVNQPARN